MPIRRPPPPQLLTKALGKDHKTADVLNQAHYWGSKYVDGRFFKNLAVWEEECNTTKIGASRSLHKLERLGLLAIFNEKLPGGGTRMWITVSYANIKIWLAANCPKVRLWEASEEEIEIESEEDEIPAIKTEVRRTANLIAHKENNTQENNKNKPEGKEVAEVGEIVNINSQRQNHDSTDPTVEAREYPPLPNKAWSWEPYLPTFKLSTEELWHRIDDAFRNRPQGSFPLDFGGRGTFNYRDRWLDIPDELKIAIVEQLLLNAMQIPETGQTVGKYIADKVCSELYGEDWNLTRLVRKLAPSELI